MNTLIFDIETIPDIIQGRRLYHLPEMSATETAEALAQLRREKTNGSDFLPHYLQQIVAIAVILITPDSIRVCSIGELDHTEAELIKRFFNGIDRYRPLLVSWNGTGFDLPVLHYRALLRGIQSITYWENGDYDSSFKGNNYLNRFHYRHTDLMDVLAAYQPRAWAPLNEIAVMLDLPGKLGMDGGKVWDSYQAGNLHDIRCYCETDVLNTYLIYLRFELIRGKLTSAHYDAKCQQLWDWLTAQSQPHFNEFLTAWNLTDASRSN